MFDPGFYPQSGAESVVACSFDLDGLILLFVLPALTSSGGQSGIALSNNLVLCNLTVSFPIHQAAAQLKEEIAT